MPLCLLFLVHVTYSSQSDDTLAQQTLEFGSLCSAQAREPFKLSRTGYITDSQLSSFYLSFSIFLWEKGRFMTPLTLILSHDLPLLSHNLP